VILALRPTVSTDYPDFAQAVAQNVAHQKSDLGLLVCATGVGMSIAANKVAGARAALVFDEKMAALARQHNNANVLCLGGNLFPDQAKRSWTPFSTRILKAGDMSGASPK